jgi:hypothetical protein
MGGIFISYRRGDSGPYAGRLRDTLSLHFGATQVFRDIDKINPGERFPQIIERAVGSCEALLAVIGPKWLSIKNEARQRRLDDPNDYVRQEIAAALGRPDVLVIPVLIGAASMPNAADLPEALAPLAECNAVRVTDEGWDDQVARLIKALETVVKRPEASPSPPPVAASAPGLRAVLAGGWRRWSARRKALAGTLVAMIAAVLIAVVAVVIPSGGDNISDRRPSGAGTSANADAVAQAGESAPPPTPTGPAPRLLSVGRSKVDLSSACYHEKGWAFPQTIDTLPWVAYVSDEAWVARYGGVPVSGNYYAFSLSALTSASVEIEWVEPRVISHAEPVRGVYPPPWTGGCGGFQPSMFRVNLDNTPLSFIAVPGDDVGGPFPAIPLPHIIDHNRPEVWYVAAVTEKCSCEWEADIHWRSGDQTGVETLNDQGKPFRVTATTLTTRIDNANGTLTHWRVTPAT